jgi:hypothetical protein
VLDAGLGHVVLIMLLSFVPSLAPAGAYVIAGHCFLESRRAAGLKNLAHKML